MLEFWITAWKVRSPSTVFFLVRIFLCGDLVRKSLYSVRIQGNKDQKKLRIWTLFTQWIFLNFLKLDRVLDMRRDAVMEEFWIFQNSKYARFLLMQAFHKTLNMPENCWIMSYGRVFNMPGQRFIGF